MIKILHEQNNKTCYFYVLYSYKTGFDHARKVLFILYKRLVYHFLYFNMSDVFELKWIEVH